jgi:hypothetical protein
MLLIFKVSKQTVRPWAQQKGAELQKKRATPVTRSKPSQLQQESGTEMDT